MKKNVYYQQIYSYTNVSTNDNYIKICSTNEILNIIFNVIQFSCSISIYIRE